MDIEVPTQRGDNFTAIDLGPMAGLDQYLFQRPNGLPPAEGKVFLNQLLGLTGSEISVNKLAAGKGVPFLHKHKLNEEVFFFLKGSGEFQVDGKIIPVMEGSAIRVARGGERSVRNTSNEELFYLCFQSREGSHEGHTIQDGIRVDKPISWDLIS